MDIDSLKQMFDMHIKECDQRDERNSNAIVEMKDLVKGVWDSQDKMQESITKLYIRGAMILGGLIVLGRIMDWIAPLILGHKP